MSSIIFILSTVLLGIAWMIWWHHFLSVNKPVKSSNYVMEGWLEAYPVEHACSFLSNNTDAKLFIVG